MYAPWTEWGEVCGAALVAQRLMHEDPELSNILALQTAWLRTGQPEALEFALEPVREVSGAGPKARSKLWLGDVFAAPLVAMRGPQGNVAWLHDHERVGDGYAATEASVGRAQAALGATLSGPRRPGLRQLRLLLVEGLGRTLSTLTELRATALVTHLTLRATASADEGPLAAQLPGLLGLACDASHLSSLIDVEHPTLRALIVEGQPDPGALLAALDRLPALRFLGLRGAERDAVSQLILHRPALGLWGVDLPEAAAGVDLEPLLASDGLCYLGLPRGAVGDETRARLAARGPVVFSSPDRREVLALDFETHGWGYGAG